ncbi:MAG TPA: Rieske 2Fe-2S domain-containing protein [Xanthobacteraceae bacterium]
MTVMEQFNARPRDMDFVHTGAGTLAGRYLRRFWQPVFRAQDLPPGRAFPLRIMGEEFTLYRGQSGTAHVVGPRCAHRRTQLSVGWVEDDCIRCFYHGWKYDGSGQCVEQPAERKSFAAEVRIPSYPTVEYLDLIFAYLGDGEPPELPRYPELEAEGVLEAETFVRACNYFNDLDNACDPYHVAFVHQGSRINVNAAIDPANIVPEESEFGITIKLRRTIEGGGVRLNLFGMPNVQLLRLPSLDPDETMWREFISWRVPADDDHYVSFNLNLVHITGDAAVRFRRKRAEALAKAPRSTMELAQLVLSGKATIDDLRGKVPDVVRLQDDVVLTAQGAIPDRENEYLGRSDVAIVLLRKIWRRELQALAAGKPLKPWKKPPDLVATNGLAKL